MSAATRNSSSTIIYLIIAISGFATLSWEIIWQIKSTLALGVSAWASAITLAVMMGGMGVGGYVMGNALKLKSSVQALRLYGSLEIIAGLAGLFLNAAFNIIERLDTWAYGGMSGNHSLINIIGITAVLGVPTLCMGATLPVFGLIAKQLRASITKLYSLNTLGAAFGALVVALCLIPSFGMTMTIEIIATINIMLGMITWLLSKGVPTSALPIHPAMLNELSMPQLGTFKKIFIVAVTGFATFTLEIAWFRSLASIFPNTTDVFAMMLAGVLIALGLAAKNIERLKQNKKALGTQICLAGILILLFTPLLERVDIFLIHQATINENTMSNLNWLLHADTLIINWYAVLLYALQTFSMFFLICCIVVPAVRFLGIAFPWIIDNENRVHSLGKLYAVNTFSAIFGAIFAAWFLLPTIGFAKTAWLAGVLVLIAGMLIIPRQKRLLFTLLGMAALLIAIFFETGIGRIRVQGDFAFDRAGNPAKVLEFFEGPEATVSALQYGDGARILLINSTLAALESGEKVQPSIHYMAWMGHLPMLLHPNPKKALVICFGTGQTANAVRKEHASEIDIVDINANVFKLAHHFRSNEGVLNDPRVKAIVMDGRAYMRRTRKIYDVITLEPMPPITNGANALYSKEFYELAKKSLGEKGVIAQWLPFHMVAPHYAASIARTFRAVFPNAILWIDPDSKTGILLATKDDHLILTTNWPGFARMPITRNLSAQKVEQAIALNAKELEQYSKYGEVITDDNQLLAYGKALYAFKGFERANFNLLHRINNKIAQ